MQPAAASIVCSALRRWADDSPAAPDPAAGYDDEQALDGDDDESGDRQLQVEALSALATLLRDNLAQVNLCVCVVCLRYVRVGCPGVPSLGPFSDA